MKINKWDMSIFVIFVIIGAMSFAYIAFINSQSDNDTVVVSKDGKNIGEYSLFKDREININRDGHINKINIKNGNVQMTFANCSNQDCIRQGKINDGSKSIICLPNKVVVQIKSKSGEFDTITR